MARTESAVTIELAPIRLDGVLSRPGHVVGTVLFAHGSGSSRMSPRNRYVAGVLQEGGIATLLFDLLTREEDTDYATRFDIDLLSQRLVAATRWLQRLQGRAPPPIGYFGASTGAAAALRAAASLDGDIAAVVSRGGRPDLAGAAALARVRSPTLLLVGGFDPDVLALNEEALACLHCTKGLTVIPGATHLFEEPGTLEQVADAARQWFLRYLPQER